MTMTDIGATQGAQAGSPTAAMSETNRSRNSIAETFDTFLTLLTTQLKNQDPINPMETNEFTNQLVSFTQVEQAIQTNERLDDLINQAAGSQLTTASALVGKFAEFEGNAIKVDPNGDRGTWAYRLPNQSRATALSIVNENGTLVRTLTGETSAGWHEVSWDGKDSAGNDVPAGVYRLRVDAIDATDEAINVSQTVVDRVRTASLDGFEAVLEVGGSAVPLSSVLAIREAPQSLSPSEEETTPP